MKRLLEWVSSSQFLRALLIGFIVLLLQIPIAMLYGVISERQQSRDNAVEEVTAKWGRSQEVVGPVLVVPFKRKKVEDLGEGKSKITYQTKHAIFLPDSLEVKASVDSETRYRGIYQIPVYRSDFHLRGQFSPLDFSRWEVADSDVLWDRATVNFVVSDIRALASVSDFQWGDDSLKFEPGTRISTGSGLHVRLAKEEERGVSIPFSMDLSLHGSGELSIAPVGSQTRFDIESNWTEPSFQGNWLPAERKVTEDGFEAHWSVQLLGRNYPQNWVGRDLYADQIERSFVGVRFLAPIDHYRMAFRSVKYEILFLILIFMTLWLFEVLSDTRIHAIQYIFVGAAMCLFYLLELSLAEHLGFVWAYGIAGLLVCALIVGYSRAVLKTTGRASMVGGVLAMLYVYLYMLLVNQDYALLAGSLGLFVALAVVMYLTRNVDWHALSAFAEEDAIEES